MNTILELFYSLFGYYSPVQTLVSGSVEAGDAVYQVSTNYGYIFHAVFVLIILYSFFRLVGLLLGGGRR